MQLDIKHLRRLHQTVLIPRHGLLQMPYGFYHRDDGNGGTRFAGCLVTVAYHLHRRERSYPIVHTHQSLCIIRNQLQAVLDGVEARLAAISNGIVFHELVFIAQRLPVFLLLFGEHKDDVQLLAILTEPLHGVHQHGQPPNGQELLGDISPHT